MQIGVLEAKNRFSEIVAAAERGEEVVITRRGEPVVRLQPVRQPLDASAGAALMRRVRERRDRLGFVTSWRELKADRDEGRR